MPLKTIVEQLKAGTLVPYLGAGALRGSQHEDQPIPADSNSLILAMNNGKPMAPKLMYEFPRAAMNQELKKGRNFLTQFLVKLYKDTPWSLAPLHAQLSRLKLPYIVDVNRDTQLQTHSGDHTLICGLSRVMGTDYRFKLFEQRNGEYREVSLETVDRTLPILFKPLGTPIPEANFIASDADFVDYITELMGGFAIPSFLKDYRKGKQYLFIGMRFSRDTERMVMSDIIYDANPEGAGYALIAEPSLKELKFCKRMNIDIIRADVADLLTELETA